MFYACSPTSIDKSGDKTDMENFCTGAKFVISILRRKSIARDIFHEHALGAQYSGQINLNTDLVLSMVPLAQFSKHRGTRKLSGNANSCILLADRPLQQTSVRTCLIYGLRARVFIRVVWIIGDQGTMRTTGKNGAAA